MSLRASALSIFAGDDSHLQQAIATRSLLSSPTLFFGRNQKGRIMYLRYVSGKGFAVEQVVPDADALSYLIDQGVPKPEAVRVLSALKTSAVAKDRAHTMMEFIARHCLPTYGQIAFAEFFDRFRESLPPDQRYVWTRTVLTRALPPQHRTMPGTANRKFVPGLSWRA